MEPIFQAHPIPQNVTNFEFHLVGDMTLKQFGYLAAGLGFAFLIFTTLSTAQPLIAWPIIVISALLGVAFAFLPIQERPLDHWVGAFFRAIFKPTSLRYTSKIINPEDPLFNRRLTHYLKTYQKTQLLPPLPPLPIDRAAPPGTAGVKKKESFMDKFKAGQTNFGPPQHHVNAPVAAQVPQPPPAVPGATPARTFEPLPSLQTPQPPARTPQPSAPTTNPTPPQSEKLQATIPLPSQPGIVKSEPKSEPAKPQDLKKTVELAKEAQETQQEIAKIETSLSQIKQQAAQPGVDPKTYIEEFEDLLTQLQKLNEKASSTAQELAKVSNLPSEPLQPVDVAQSKPAEPVKARSIPTLKLTSFPNVINGIVTDSQGNYIEGAIVVAHDKQGLPVRALKSNKLGQFVAATPLPNGEYAIMVEKENLSFDKVGIELKNEILPPILVAAKKIIAAV